MFRFTFLLTLIFPLLWGAPTLQTMKKESRVAIVVGNSSYDDHELSNPHKNARKMKKFLEKNGFYVYYGENLDKRNFVRLLRKFNKALKPKGVGLFYYSGHAVQTKGKNYLITLDNGILNESMIVRKSISLDSIYRSMSDSYNRLNIVILDTAYDAPFGTLFSPHKKGLAPITSSKAQVTFLATAANKINTSNSFSDDFITLAKTKGVEITSLKKRLILLRQKHHQPKPSISIAKNQPFYFVLPNKIPTQDELAYSKIKESSNQKELKKFLNTYPKSPYTKNIQKQLNKLRTEEQLRTKEENRRKFEQQAAEATKKAREAARAANERERKALKMRAERDRIKAEKRKNDISFKLTKPEDVVKKKAVKPKPGEERQINLE